MAPQEKTFPLRLERRKCGPAVLQLNFSVNWTKAGPDLQAAWTILMPTRGADHMIKPHYDDKLESDHLHLHRTGDRRGDREAGTETYIREPRASTPCGITPKPICPPCPPTTSAASPEIVKDTSHSRAGGRTALVFSTAMLTEMGPLLVSISEIEVPDAKIKVFNDLTAGPGLDQRLSPFLNPALRRTYLNRVTLRAANPVSSWTTTR